MLYEFAPMEGLTTWYFRQLHHTFFGGAARYYTPFLSANQNLSFQSREKAEIAPEHNQGIALVPQIMTNRADEFVWAVRYLEERGYQEVDLNLGCPASQVVNRKKGSGFLENPDALDRFFEETFSLLSKQDAHVRISVKTRIGYHSPSEADGLLRIYNRYPLSEVIIHPRTRKEYYKGTPHRDVFRKMLEESVNPVCYNGDLHSAEDCRALMREFPADRYPKLKGIMIGRGLLADPPLFRELQGGSALTEAECRSFTDALYQNYRAAIDGGDLNILHKMKEMWTYLGTGFVGKDGSRQTAERALRDILKTNSLTGYQIAVDNFFALCRRIPPQLCCQKTSIAGECRR